MQTPLRYLRDSAHGGSPRLVLRSFVLDRLFLFLKTLYTGTPKKITKKIKSYI